MDLSENRPPFNVPFYEQRFDDESSFSIAAGHDSRLQLMLLQDLTHTDIGPAERRLKMEVVHVVHTPRLLGAGRLVLQVGWNAGKFTDFHINNQSWKFSTYGATIPGMISLKERAVAASQDFTEQNEKAVVQRRQRLMGWQPVPRKQHGGRDYAFASLKHEVHQITDLLELTQSGKEHHILGLSARLRLLIAGKTPLGLLQLCAAYLNAPLTIFTNRSPGAPPPVKVEYQFSIALSPTKQEVMDNPIDLDVWLGLKQIYSQGVAYSPLEVIKKIGDTIGSHLDIDVHPVVSDLRKTAGMFRCYNDVTVLIESTARAVLHLAEGLLRESAADA